MWECNYTSELYHHGILGMKWGKRRFQNKSGTLTPSGKKRYDNDGPTTTSKSTNNKTATNKSKHRSNLEESYRNKGMSQKEAESAAEKRIKTEKIIAITAGLTVAAATAYVVNKHIKEKTDGIIKSGTKMQVIADKADKNFDKAFYTAYKDSDKTKYKGLYGKQIQGGGGAPHKITLNADKDIKIVSRKKAADTFADLYKSDPEFKVAFDKSNKRMLNPIAPQRNKIIESASKNMSDKQLRKKGYDAFNIGLVNHDDDGNTISKKFYDKLKEQGYDAVMDLNDQKYSGYKAKKPVIVFNKGNKISISDVKKMTDEQIASNANKAYNQLYGPKIAAAGASYVAMIAGGVYGTTKLEEMVNNQPAVNATKKTNSRR